MRAAGWIVAAVFAALVLWSSPASAQTPPPNWQFGAVPGAAVSDTGSASLLYGSQTQVFFQSDGNLFQSFRTGNGPWVSAVLDGDGGDRGRTTANVGAGVSGTNFGDQLQLFYVDESNGRLRQAFYSPTTGLWTFVDLDGPGVGGGNGRLPNVMGGRTTTVVFRGGPHVFYLDATTTTLRHAWWGGSAWFFENLDGFDGANGRVNASIGPESAAVVIDATLRVFYRNADVGRLRAATVSGPTWQFTDLDGPRVPGGNGRQRTATGNAPAAVTFGGQPHVFYRSDDFELRHGWRTPSGGWNFETLANVANCPSGSSPQLALPAFSCAPGGSPTAIVWAQGPQVFHHDTASGRLLQAWWNGTKWQQRLLDGSGATGSVGQTNSPVGGSASAIVPAAGPMVQYFDSATATMRSGSWGPAPPAVVTPPEITGNAIVGSTLSVSSGTWNGNPTDFTYQWERCTIGPTGWQCSGIFTVAGPTYTATEFDYGYVLQVTVTATNGAGATVATTQPTTPIGSLRDVVDVSQGLDYSCAVLGDGTVRCWGWNYYGQLGDGTTTSSSVPVPVKGITTAVEVDAGDYSTCARLADATLRCWGVNIYGQLGDGSTQQSLVPVTVSGITNAVEVSVGTLSACARLADATVRCWGDGQSGQLGNGGPTSSSVPLQVSGINTAAQLAVGDGHACVRLFDAKLRCWGANESGQVGNGTDADVFVPTEVSGVSAAIDVAAGGGHSCAVLVDGSMRCWGRNIYGQLGDGTTQQSLVPVPVSNLTGAVQATAGSAATCSRLGDGTLRCWGFNSGSLGDGSYDSSSVPVVVLGIDTAAQVSSGRSDACARLADATVRCWGSNFDGQVGNGTSTRTSFPVVTIDPQRAPVNVVAPTVAGSAIFGSVLTASNGTWAYGVQTFEYRWQRCETDGANCIDIVDATESTYTVTDEDEDRTLRVVVTATNALGSTEATSSRTGIVIVP